MLTLRSILRTLARLRILTRVPTEDLADALVPHMKPGDVRFLAEYLHDVAELMGKRRPQRQCLECGKLLDSAFFSLRSDARYCSAECRQASFRKRRRNGSSTAGNTTAVAGNGSTRARKQPAVSVRDVAKILGVSAKTLLRDMCDASSK
jgi:hypothetical protein